MRRTGNQIMTEFILCVFTGAFGGHHFYRGRVKKGLLYLFTCGLFGIGWIIDVISLGIKAFSSNSTDSIVVMNLNTENPYINAVPHEVYCNAYIQRRSKTIPNDYVVFDTETTGLEPEINKIIEISAIKFKNNKKVDTFTTLVNPNMVIDKYITTLTGIKQSDLDYKPTIDVVLPEFFKFIEGYTLVAHNAQYDIKMLACECYRNRIRLCNNKIVDTLYLSKRMIPRERIENYKLSTLKDHFNLNYVSHRALADCEVCAYIYQLYLSKQQDRKVVIIDNNTGEILEEIN